MTDNNEIVQNLQRKEKSASKASHVGYIMGIAGLATAVAVEMYTAARHIGSGWFKEYISPRSRVFRAPEWYKTALRNPLWTLGVGVGLGGIVFGLFKDNQAETLADVKNAMLPEGKEIPSPGDNQWQTKVVCVETSAPVITK